MSGHDAPVVVMSSPHVPIELVYAARLRPQFVRGASTPTPVADAHLEAGVFPNRIRQLIELALAGRLSDAAAIVLPRTSEADYKAFLYLREFARQGTLSASLAVLLMDLLQSGGPHVLAHNANATRALFASLVVRHAEPSGAERWYEDLRDAIARVNRARAALRRVLALRTGWPRITGAEALPLIAAFHDQPPESFAAVADAAATTVAARPPFICPRVLLLGASVDGASLHAAIEAHGAVVVAETGPWGGASAGVDVDVDAEPFAALAEKYRQDSWGPRTPIDQVRRWITRSLDGVDAVVVSLPPDDGAFGWDYSWLRDHLAAMDVPHARLTSDPDAPMSDQDHDRLADLIETTLPRAEAQHG